MTRKMQILSAIGVAFFLLPGSFYGQEQDSVPSQTVIEEVVLVGYGTAKKSTNAGAAATLDVDVVQDRPVSSLLTSMQGVLPGVTILQRPGDVGSDGGTPNIRGRGNLGASAPLFVVDGVIVSQSDFTRINPSDIENLTVLKDAAAAIYGSRAAYGVILVTTKKGRGGKMNIGYDGWYGYQSPTYLPEKVGSVDYMMLRNEAAQNAGKPAYYTQEQIEKARSGSEPDLYPNTDWYDLVYRDAAPITEHVVNISGGGKTRYYMSLGYFNQESLLPNKGLDRYTLRANTTSKISKSLTVSSNLSFVKETIESDFSRSILVPLARAVPTMVPVQSNGEWGTINAGKLDATLGADNPLRTLSESGESRNNFTTFLGSITATLKPFKGFTLNGQISYKDRNVNNSTFEYEMDPLVDFFTGEPIIGTGYTPNSYSEVWAKSNSYTAQIYGSYETSIDNHHFKLLVGASYEDSTYRQISAKRKNMLSNSTGSINAGSSSDGNVFNGGYSQAEAFQSVFSRLNYNYKGKYFLEGIFRADASSRFSPETRWGYFPSVLASWRIDKENFMDNVDFVNNLKLRASYGQTGNVYNVGYWDYLNLLSTGSSAVLDNGKVTGVWPAAMPNPNLKWETVISKNIGLDGVLFNRKFSFQLDLFDRLTKDILFKVPVPAEYGVGSGEWPSENLAEVTNKGIELSLGYQNNDSEFKYYINGNLAKIWNEVTKLNDPIISGLWILREGDAVGSFYGYEADGLYTQADLDSGYPRISVNTAPGDIKIVDQNNDGAINADDRVVLGNDVPYFTYGISGGFTYKNFDFSFIGQGVADVKVYLSAEASQAFFNGGGAKSYVLGRWTAANPDPNAVYPRLLESANNNQNTHTSSFWLFNASYFRIKSMTLGYTFGEDLVSNLGINKFRIYLTANNLITFRGDKRMKDFDPEMASSRATYPQLKTVSFGVNVNF